MLNIERTYLAEYVKKNIKKYFSVMLLNLVKFQLIYCPYCDMILLLASIQVGKS